MISEEETNSRLQYTSPRLSQAVKDKMDDQVIDVAQRGTAMKDQTLLQQIESMSVDELCKEVNRHCITPEMRQESQKDSEKKVEIEDNYDDDDVINSQMDLDGMIEIASATIKDYALPQDAYSSAQQSS